MASELYNTIDALSREKGIDPQIVVSAVEDAIVMATRKYYKSQENLRSELDKETGKIRAFAIKTVVESQERSSINTILHEVSRLFVINGTIRDIKSKNVFRRVNRQATMQWINTEKVKDVHVETVARHTIGSAAGENTKIAVMYKDKDV